MLSILLNNCMFKLNFSSSSVSWYIYYTVYSFLRQYCPCCDNTQHGLFRRVALNIMKVLIQEIIYFTHTLVVI